MAAIFTYGFPEAEEAFRNASVQLCTLGNYNTMLEVDVETEYIRASDVETLKEWRTNPSEWTPVSR